MKKILLPTDFSKESNEVIEFALEAFNDEPCVFYFIHTYHNKVYELDAIRLLQQRSDFFNKPDFIIFKKMVDQVSQFANRERYAKHFLKLLCNDTELISGVQQAIEELDIDIVLVGTQGENPKTKRYKEETVNKIIQEVKTCPVMAVPLNGEAWASMGLENLQMAS